MNPFVSRGGLKLAHALDAFAIDVTGMTCADLGCSTGGFTDCLLQRGAVRVHAVDTAYGELAWKLRQDPHVVVHERSNALHLDPPEPVDLVVIDLGWTRQQKAIPVGLQWLNDNGRIVSLIKPHYEIERSRFDGLAVGGVLPDDVAEGIAQSVVARFEDLGVEAGGLVQSPLRGGKGGKGNLEWLVIATRP